VHVVLEDFSRQEPVVQYASSAARGPSDDDRSAGDRRRNGRAGGGPPRQRGGAGPSKNSGRKRRDPLWAKLLVIFGALLMLTSGVAIFGTKALLAEATKSVSQQNLLGSAGADRTHATVNGAKNILLVGVDSRPDQSASDLVRSDSIIILHIPATHDQGYMISIPRDTYVDIPAYDNGKDKYNGGRDKINAAFAFGGQGLTGDAARQHGFELLEKTIQALPGMSSIKFDAGAIVDFTGFQQVVSVLGGVTMYVDETTKSIHVGFTKSGKEEEPFHINSDGTVGSAVPGVTPETYTQGTHHLSAWQALDYVRQRDLLANGDGDYGRQRHQQQFIKAIFKEILSSGTLTNPSKLSKVLDTVGKAMTVDSGGVSIEDWIFAMRNIGANDLLTIKTNDGQYSTQMINGQSVQTLDDTSMQLLQSVVTDSVGSFVQIHPDWVATS
jgi:LCP family protein required for cell wall assembly